MGRPDDMNRKKVELPKPEEVVYISISTKSRHSNVKADGMV